LACATTSRAIVAKPSAPATVATAIVILTATPTVIAAVIGRCLGRLSSAQTSKGVAVDLRHGGQSRRERCTNDAKNCELTQHTDFLFSPDNGLAADKVPGRDRWYALLGTSIAATASPPSFRLATSTARAPAASCSTLLLLPGSRPVSIPTSRVRNCGYGKTARRWLEKFDADPASADSFQQQSAPRKTRICPTYNLDWSRSSRLINWRPPVLEFPVGNEDGADRASDDEAIDFPITQPAQKKAAGRCCAAREPPSAYSAAAAFAEFVRAKPAD